MIYNDELFDDKLYGQDFHLKDEDRCYTDDDFYPPSDDRVWKSNVDDIDGGDNFADYCGYIFGVLEEEEYFDN